jgi:hypothetical protein
MEPNVITYFCGGCFPLEVGYWVTKCERGGLKNPQMCFIQGRGLHSSGQKKSNQVQAQSRSSDLAGCVAPDPNHEKSHFGKAEVRNVDVPSLEMLMSQVSKR